MDYTTLKLMGEYVLCYSTAYFLGFFTAVGLVLLIKHKGARVTMKYRNKHGR